MGATTITRRRALVLGAAAGLGSLLARPFSAFGRGARARARGFGMAVRPEDFEGVTSRVLRAPRRFDLLGVRGPDAARGRFEVRVRPRGGHWSPWVTLAVHGDHAPDTGTGERASDPVWTGGCDELQLRAARRLRGPLRVHFVAVPAAGRRLPRARAAASPKQQAAPQPGTPPPIIPRDAWGAAAVPPRSAPDYGVVQMAFVHHTVTASDYTPDQSASMVLGIAKYHRDTNGWNDIGYNFLVDQYGQVFEGRAGGVDQAVIGAQSQGYNSQSAGVAVLGTFSDVPIPEPAMAAITQLLGWKLSLHGVPCEGGLTIVSGGGSLNRYPSGTPVAMQRISGHRDGDKTACPGNALYAQLPDLRHRAAALAGPIVARGVVSLRPSADAIDYGADAVFTGTVIRSDATAGAGEAVALQKRGTVGAWVTVARTTALVDGSWVVRVPWRRGADVRAVSAGVTSKAIAVKVTPAVTTRRAPKRVSAGSAVALSGRVRPAVGVSVLLEREGADGRFHRVRLLRGSVRKTTWRCAVRLRRPGLYRLSARTAAKDGDV
ncbi:MAG TPA: N-acetylmuramoyl-L-alanine amidase, partial [Solirubrobacteraceae bacterium]|nr:N-acetylmuramoyl-L-alanine amidase [Solirubrobacteraceae bacterium]